MSEKRFIALGSRFIKDTLTGEEFYAPNEDELLDLLNAQQATIHELQSIINHIKCEENCEDYDYCCETVCSLYDEIKHLKEENEQLRQKLECCEYKHFKKELDKIHKKVEKGDLNDFCTLTISDKGLEHWNGDI